MTIDADEPKLIPFEVMHLVSLAMQEELPDEMVIMLASVFQQSLGFTGISGNEVIASGGISPLWPGVAHAWFVPGPGLRKHLKWTIKTLHTMLKEAEEMSGFWRIQTFIPVSANQGFGKLVNSLGFVLEGQMNKYGPNKQTYLIYSRVKE